jgi:acyl carrier protein phosphodiesterase
MNYLAHLCLAPPGDDALLGSLMGDFVKGPLPGGYPPGIAHAMVLHRRIDAFTDAHPRVRLSRERVSGPRRRFAGIMVDLFYDHFLARHWHRYSHEQLDAFTHRVYALLARRERSLPPRLREVAARMRETDWLGAYREIGNIHIALDRMSLRLRRENRLRGSAEELEARYDEFDADFRAFFPDLADFARLHHHLPSATPGAAREPG